MAGIDTATIPCCSGPGSRVPFQPGADKPSTDAKARIDLLVEAIADRDE